MTKDDCLTLHENVVQKKASIWALFLLNLPLALAIINSCLSYDFKNLYKVFNVTSDFHKSLVFVCLIIPLIILFYSWYKYNHMENNLTDIKIRLNNLNTKTFDTIAIQLNDISKIGNKILFLNILTIVLYVIQFYFLFINKV